MKKIFIAQVLVAKRKDKKGIYKSQPFKFIVDADAEYKVKQIVESALKELLEKNNAEIRNIKTTYITYDYLLVEKKD